MGETVLSMIFPLIGVILVILLAYVGTVWISKKSRMMTSGRYMKVLERSMLGKDAYLALVKINDKAYFLSVTSHGTQVLDTLDAEAVPELPVQELTPNFQELFASLSKKWETVEKKLKNREGQEKKKQ